MNRDFGRILGKKKSKWIVVGLVGFRGGLIKCIDFPVDVTELDWAYNSLEMK